jgi:serine acetyltransferase
MPFVMGIEIRSDAQVVRGLFIHGTGVVIEETATMEDDVALDHGMTLAGAGRE